MSFLQQFTVLFFKGITNVICQIDDNQLKKIPERGPMILVTNHVNILEIPIIYTHLYPRPINGMVWAERWEHAWSRWLLNVCEAIPLRRGEADVASLRKGLDLLTAGHILVISPEGTRSGDGRLQPAYPGVVLLGSHSGAPLLPVAYHGSEYYKQNIRHLKRTDLHITVGKPFRLNTKGIKVTQSVRSQILDEIMYQLSILLPPVYRGVYSNLSLATQRYLSF